MKNITEVTLDGCMEWFDRWSRVLAWAAVLSAVVYIIIPALVAIWRQ